MSKIDVTYTPEEILQYAERDRVVASMASLPANDISGSYQAPSVSQNGIYYVSSFYGTRRTSIELTIPTTLLRYPNNGRICGYVASDNADGSHDVFLIGNNISFNFSHLIASRFQFQVNLPYTVVEGVSHFPAIGEMPPTSWYPPGTGETTKIEARCYDFNGQNFGYSIPFVESEDYLPTWHAKTSGSLYSGNRTTFIASCGRYAGSNISSDYGNLKMSPGETLELGHPFGCYYMDVSHEESVISWGYRNIGGNLFEVGNLPLGVIRGSIANGDPYDWLPENIYGATTRTFLTFDAQVELGTYAFAWVPFNIVLTRSLPEAQNYVTNGVLPSDAWIYPYDVDNIPVNDSGTTPEVDPEPPSPFVPDPDGDVVDDVDPMPADEPDQTAQSLTNNNLYWINSAQLKRFIDWFWTDATDIATLGDLWDKIRGLYENLAECLLAVRYYPVQSSWIGGVSSDTKIIVGMIEKEEQVLTLNKTVSPLRNLGTYNVEEMYKYYTDYSPYVDISLYLPFHGMVSLDTDMLMTKQLAVQCAYDVMTGTIQYFVYRNGYGGQLLTTCVAKMAVDIPITLQTKNQRDSATFQNVANVAGNLIGAGASIATGNPIGLTMSLAGFAGTQTQGAHMDVKGNVSENGAFYQPTKCAIYIKHPTYNIPKDTYAESVGFPCNGTFTLKAGDGYAVIQNPHLKFKSATKPTKQEIDDIYAALEKGVIL